MPNPRRVKFPVFRMGFRPTTGSVETVDDNSRAFIDLWGFDPMIVGAEKDVRMELSYTPYRRSLQSAESYIKSAPKQLNGAHARLTHRVPRIL